MIVFPDEKVNTQVVAQCKAMLCLAELHKLKVVKLCENPNKKQKDGLLSLVEFATGLIFRSFRLRVKQPSASDIAWCAPSVNPTDNRFSPRELRFFVRGILPRIERKFSEKEKV